MWSNDHGYIRIISMMLQHHLLFDTFKTGFMEEIHHIKLQKNQISKLCVTNRLQV